MIYGYIRASVSLQEAAPEVQRKAIEEYTRIQLGKPVDACFLDPAEFASKEMWLRPAGKELMVVLRQGDDVVIQRIDRVARSLIRFCHVLRRLQDRGVTLHISNFPDGPLGPANPVSQKLAHAILSFGDLEHAVIAQRIKERTAELKRHGQKHDHNTEYGFKWEKRYDYRQGKYVLQAVRCEREQAIMKRCVVLRAEGHSYKQIADYLNFEWKVRTRHNGQFRPIQVKRMLQAALTAMQQSSQYTTDGSDDDADDSEDSCERQ